MGNGAIPVGTAFVWHPESDKPMAVECACPENSLDGDRFWIWVHGNGLSAGFEEVGGQTAECAGWLLRRFPRLAGQVFDDRVFGGWEGMTLAEVADARPAVRSCLDVGTWFHGTSDTDLEAKLGDGLTGDLPPGKLAWPRVMDRDPGVVYLADRLLEAVSYAGRAVRMRGGQPIVLEISAAVLPDPEFVEDRDFRYTPEWNRFRAGCLGDASAADASLTHDGKVGIRGVVPPDAIVAVHHAPGLRGARVTLPGRPSRPCP